MATSSSGTWHLSPNDVAALRHVLDLIDALANELAERDNEEPWQTIEWAERQMEASE
jgi:hypothetical protein